jgi:hypothetical protein
VNHNNQKMHKTAHTARINIAGLPAIPQFCCALDCLWRLRHNTG